ncbi:type III-B CRISPR module RAMP protein Cmr6 [Deinococcus oregonensis]|uniref:Type III-B CRISPR module RAMP protein Cmr6 n=1 Tax=Deinococcus oregonensis TaxID=1805970 RepID=A0ABV6AWT4_9DEIO
MRQTLSGFPAVGATHAGQLLGLLFDGSEKEARAEFLKTAAKIKPSSAYQAAFEVWRGVTLPSITATTSGPLAIGLGNASPTEVGLTLHRTYGLPYLPGSALKGLAVRAARDYPLGEAACKALFGDAESAAHLIWWDGWLDPACRAPLQLDTITVHHQKYYGSAGQSGPQEIWPTDFDDPNPVAFLSVPPHTKFHLALGKSTPELDDQWVHLAAELLGYGLSKLGLGGKTNAGYGSFEVTLPPKLLRADEIEAANQKAEQVAQTQAAAEDAQLVSRIAEELKNARAIRENAERMLSRIAALPVERREKPVSAVLEQARKFGEKELAKKARKLLEEQE